MNHHHSIFRAVTCLTLVLLLGLAAATPSLAANTCTNDLQGVDDEPQQKDLTQWCSGTTADYSGLGCLFSNGFDFSIKWNWDDTGLPGGNSGDACALFDTNNDNKANYALCVDIAGRPVTMQFVKLYSCANDRLERCSNAALVTTPPLHTFCAVNTSATDPFGPGNHSCQGTSCKPNDASAACCIDTVDVGGATATLLDVCSYPSQQPNSDPSDCVITATGQDPCAGVNCNDNNVCTNDSCNPDTGACVHTNNTAACDDGNACTTNDICSGGACAGGPPPNCNDGNVCTNDGCNPASGCFHNNNTLPCDDGSACTTGDVCSAGSCAGGPPPNCNDGNVCTDDGCNPASGCFHNNNTAPCDDRDACTTGDVCQNGACAQGTAIVITGSGAACDDDAGCSSTEVCAATPGGGGVCVVRRTGPMGSP